MNTATPASEYCSGDSLGTKQSTATIVDRSEHATAVPRRPKAFDLRDADRMLTRPMTVTTTKTTNAAARIMTFKHLLFPDDASGSRRAEPPAPVWACRGQSVAR